MERDSLGFDPNTPNVARLYDYFLGGKDHLPVDREAAEKILAVAPELRAAARANRAFLGRAVRFLARSGIRQFLDIGTGLPTQGAVHEVANEVLGSSRVAYVDVDPVVMVHARALLDSDQDTRAVEGDLRTPQEILKNPEVAEIIDFSKPVGILLVAIMHFIDEADDPAQIMRTLHEAMAPGSYLVLSHGTSDARAAAVSKGTEVYQNSTSRLFLRDRRRIEALFEGFELVEPGLVWLPEWRPDETDALDFLDGPESSLILCGVALRS